MTTKLPAPLPFAEWPESDRVAWERGTSGDPLAPGGGGAGAMWRSSTRRQVQLGYGSWLSWLEGAGLLLVSQAPAARASRPEVRAYLDALEAAGLADYTRSGRLQTLSDALRVMQPSADIGFIARGAGRIASGAVRARDPRAKLRPPAEIVAFGAELMARAEAEDGLAALDSALLFRDGLLISLWMLRALRNANLSSIEIGRQLVREGHAPAGVLGRGDEERPVLRMCVAGDDRERPGSLSRPPPPRAARPEQVWPSRSRAVDLPVRPQDEAQLGGSGHQAPHQSALRLRNELPPAPLHPGHQHRRADRRHRRHAQPHHPGDIATPLHPGEHPSRRADLPIHAAVWGRVRVTPSKRGTSQAWKRVASGVYASSRGCGRGPAAGSIRKMENGAEVVSASDVGKAMKGCPAALLQDRTSS